MSAMIQGINPELDDMVRRGQLGGKKITALYNLKKIVERYAVNGFISEEEGNDLKSRYGTLPNIVTWGDYFQTEIASRYFDRSDEEFLKITSTVRFDIIASIKIFKNKPEQFFKIVERDGYDVMGIPCEKWTEDQAEKAHLQILMRYYLNMGLENAEISAEDEEYFQSFTEIGVVQAG